MQSKHSEESTAGKKLHTIKLEDRHKATITGVEDVLSFNEQMMVLNTTSGALSIVGEELHIDKLNLEDGQLAVEGTIIAMEYEGMPAKQKSSLLSKLFR